MASRCSKSYLCSLQHPRLELLHGGFDGMKQFLVERKSPKKAFNKFHFTVHNHENELSFLQIDESFLYHHGWRTRVQ
jgi:hypothetical protein